VGKGGVCVEPKPSCGKKSFPVVSKRCGVCSSENPCITKEGFQPSVVKRLFGSVRGPRCYRWCGCT